MTDMEWATICTLKQEVEYRFLEHELDVAKRMVKAGLLEQQAPGRFKVTALGHQEYAKASK